MKVHYQATSYRPELVTGRYVRCFGKKPNYLFRVFETATCNRPGQFYGKPGMGYTLREYDTAGEEIPTEIRAKCIASKTTERWD